MTREGPADPEVRCRIAGDAAHRVKLDVAALVERVAARLREGNHWNTMIAADEIATEEVDGLWFDEGLADAYGRALAEVHEQYLADAMRVRETIAALDEDGRESWIAGAIGHRLAFDVAWQAQDALGLLERFDADELCAACGAALAVEEPG